MNVPQLRFKDFSGEWEKSNLNNISANIMYGVGAAATNFDGVNKYLRITDIDEESRQFSPNPLVSPDCIIEEKYKLTRGDIVFTRTGASVGKTYLYNELDGNLIFAGFLVKFSIIKAVPKFVFLKTLTKSYQKWLLITSMRSGQAGINAEELKQLMLFLPSLPEQTKIANFLTAIDERINQLTRKKELMTQYKQGVMQQIFSQQLRFKNDNGEDFADWEEKKLGDFLQLVSRQVEKPTYNYLALGIRSHFKGTFQKPNSEPEKIDMEYLYEVQPNDLIVNITFAWEGAVAIVKKEDADGLVSHRFPTYQFNQAIMLSEYFRYVYPNERFRLELEIRSPGGAGRNRVLNKKLFLEIKVNVPSIAEQTKIANFLTVIDEKIQQISQQINATKQYKQGLLQQMFV